MISKEQAIKLSQSTFWDSMSPREIAEFQLNTERLCMPFDVFHLAMEKALGRSVWTHEFASPDSLKKEFYGEKQRPSMEEILNLLPLSMRVIVAV